MRSFLFLYLLSYSYLKGFVSYTSSSLARAVYCSRSCHVSLDTKGPSNDLKFDLGRIAFSLLPLSPESIGRRKTILTEVVKDEVWTLDQLQGIINVNGIVLLTS